MIPKSEPPLMDALYVRIAVLGLLDRLLTTRGASRFVEFCRNHYPLSPMCM